MKDTTNIRRKIITHLGNREMFVGDDTEQCWVSPTNNNVTIKYTAEERATFGLPELVTVDEDAPPPNAKDAPKAKGGAKPATKQAKKQARNA